MVFVLRFVVDIVLVVDAAAAVAVVSLLFPLLLLLFSLFRAESAQESSCSAEYICECFLRMNSDVHLVEQIEVFAYAAALLHNRAEYPATLQMHSIVFRSHP